MSRPRSSVDRISGDGLFGLPHLQSGVWQSPGAPVPVRLDEFLPDTQQIGQGSSGRATGWEQQLENNKQAFAAEFV